MKPIMYALQHSRDLTDSEFRLLVHLGEHPDGSGRTEFCEATVQRIIDVAGPDWNALRVTVSADALRDRGAPIGVVGGFVCWRPA